MSKSVSIVEINVDFFQSWHIWKVSCEIKNEHLLIQNLQRFSDLDSIGFTEIQIALCFSIIGNRKTVKFTFKDYHPVIPENYSLSATR